MEDVQSVARVSRTTRITDMTSHPQSLCATISCHTFSWHILRGDFSMKRKLTFASILFSAITILLLAPAAYGDSLTFTLLDPDQYASQGQATTLSFYTTVSAPNTNTGIEYINGDGLPPAVQRH